MFANSAFVVFGALRVKGIRVALYQKLPGRSDYFVVITSARQLLV